MDKKECEVCTKMVKAKYRHYKTWKVLAIVFILVSITFAILYFASGNMMVKEINENDIRVENGDGINENNIITGNGSTISGTVKTESNIGVIILVCVIIITGGIIGGCYIISHNKDNKSNNDN